MFGINRWIIGNIRLCCLRMEQEAVGVTEI